MCFEKFVKLEHACQRNTIKIFIYLQKRKKKKRIFSTLPILIHTLEEKYILYCFFSWNGEKKWGFLAYVFVCCICCISYKECWIIVLVKNSTTTIPTATTSHLINRYRIARLCTTSTYLCIYRSITCFSNFWRFHKI